MNGDTTFSLPHLNGLSNDSSKLGAFSLSELRPIRLVHPMLESVKLIGGVQKKNPHEFKNKVMNKSVFFSRSWCFRFSPGLAQSESIFLFIS